MMKKSNTRKKPTEAWPIPKVPNYVSEIRTMMFGMGDSYESAKGTPELVENIVKEQMREILNCAARICDMRGENSVKQEDVLFLMRKNVVKLSRFLSYLKLKDEKVLYTADIGVLEDEGVIQDSKPVKKNYQHALDSIENFDGGEIMALLEAKPFDVTKQQRLLRANRTSINLDSERYMLFEKARSTTFHRSRNFTKFCEWLNCIWDSDDFKISSDVIEILGYLARETVAELVDIALEVRRDAGFRSYNPLAGEEDATYALKVFPSNHGDKIDFFRPITPAEIREAIRRCMSVDIDPFGVCTNTGSFVPKFRLLSIQ